ncbi:MAG: DUF86 domain-containing protein [Candidatus Magnetoovum sp. WYHC-5]|nr:DUF86 domain-containing protein [Candidatus Magnetoovum sp. WYHC-5]
MSKRDYRDYLYDMLSSITDIEMFIANMTYQEFINDKKTMNAVVRSIEIIDEASKVIPKSIKDMETSVPWNKIIAMRNKITHEYFGVDLNIIWNTINYDLPALKNSIQVLVNKYKNMCGEN